MIAIVHSIYSQSVHAPARDAGLMDNDAERYCSLLLLVVILILYSLHHSNAYNCSIFCNGASWC